MDRTLRTIDEELRVLIDVGLGLAKLAKNNKGVLGRDLTLLSNMLVSAIANIEKVIKGRS